MIKTSSCQRVFKSAESLLLKRLASSLFPFGKISEYLAPFSREQLMRAFKLSFSFTMSSLKAIMHLLFIHNLGAHIFLSPHPGSHTPFPFLTFLSQHFVLANCKNSGRKQRKIPCYVTNNTDFSARLQLILVHRGGDTPTFSLHMHCIFIFCHVLPKGINK